MTVWLAPLQEIPKEIERRKRRSAMKRRWYAKNRKKYNAYMRSYRRR